MINSAVEKAFNEQIKHEMESAYLYYAMSAWFTKEGFDGMANWMMIQKDEELFHTQKFFDHILDRAGTVKVPSTDEPKHEWKDPLDAFEAAYKHEQFITDKINDLVKLAHKEGDYASVEFLQWFVKEQVEEEDSASKIVNKIKITGKEGHAVMMIDAELGQRPAVVQRVAPTEEK
ncbi:MAG TPA: ferritin [Elusimicrobiales bacterium]|nr:ferritin [Elusimicrobiales bacterium]